MNESGLQTSEAWQGIRQREASIRQLNLSSGVDSDDEDEKRQAEVDESSSNGSWTSIQARRSLPPWGLRAHK